MRNSHDELIERMKTNNSVMTLKLAILIFNTIIFGFFLEFNNEIITYLYFGLIFVSLLILILLSIDYFYRRREIIVLKGLSDFSNVHEIIFKSSHSAMKFHKMIEDSFSYVDVLTVEDDKLIFSFNTGLSDDEMSKVVHMMRILRSQLILDYDSIQQIRR